MHAVRGSCWVDSADAWMFSCYGFGYFCFCFFFSSRRRHTSFDCDWSSDVCSSDQEELAGQAEGDPEVPVPTCHAHTTRLLGWRTTITRSPALRTSTSSSPSIARRSSPRGRG